jgi:hypothetical protein
MIILIVVSCVRDVKVKEEESEVFISLKFVSCFNLVAFGMNYPSCYMDGVKYFDGIQC